jgi:hypothetical protein
VAPICQDDDRGRITIEDVDASTGPGASLWFGGPPLIVRTLITGQSKKRSTCHAFTSDGSDAWWRTDPMRHTFLILIALLAGVAAGPVIREDPGKQRAHVTPAASKTGKERLSDKGSDEQRLDDCKVAQARRTKARPADCHGEH